MAPVASIPTTTGPFKAAIACKSVAEARAALTAATRILEQLGVRLNPQKTRIVHIQQGVDFLGYRIVRTTRKSKLSRSMIQRWNPTGLIAYPTRKSIRRFRDRVRMLRRRSAQRTTARLDLVSKLIDVVATRPWCPALCSATFDVVTYNSQRVSSISLIRKCFFGSHGEHVENRSSACCDLHLESIATCIRSRVALHITSSLSP